MSSKEEQEHQETSMLRFPNSNINRRIKVACIGGGQLGRMLALEAPRLGIDMVCLDAGGRECPAAQVTSNTVVQGSLQDAKAIQQVAQGADVVTVEIEHVNVDALQALEEDHGVIVRPSARVLRIIQDKYLQKNHFSHNSNIPLPKYMATPSIASIQQAAETLGLPIMLKSRRGGYDGRGNAVLKQATIPAIRQALKSLGALKKESDNENDDDSLDIYAEGWIDFGLEVAVMVVQSADGQTTKSYPAVRQANVDGTADAADERRSRAFPNDNY